MGINPKDRGIVARLDVKKLLARETQKFEEYFVWLEKSMPASFFEEINAEEIELIVHHLMDLNVQGYFSQIELIDRGIVLLLDSPTSDLTILKAMGQKGIKNYRTFCSTESFPGTKKSLKVAMLHFTTRGKRVKKQDPLFTPEEEKEYLSHVQIRNPLIDKKEFSRLIDIMSRNFFATMTKEQKILCFDVVHRAMHYDACQFELNYHNGDHDEDKARLEIIFAWRNVPKSLFLYRIAKTIERNKLAIQKVTASYLYPSECENILVMNLSIIGKQGKAPWDQTDITDFLQELFTIKYFCDNERIDTMFVDSELVRGNLGNLLKTIISFCHQMLVHADPNLYSIQNVEEAICRHPELTVQLLSAFESKFNPKCNLYKVFEEKKTSFYKIVEGLDTGNEANDRRRKNVLKVSMLFVDFCLKSNFYRNNKTGFGFRLNPEFMNFLPFERKEKFPELPFGIFFMVGLDFVGFHIRFKDLSRGGLRTVIPQRQEQYTIERNHVFSECYNLAYTQQKKNKDIPEGGAKGVILLKNYDPSNIEAFIYENEYKASNSLSEEELTEKMVSYHEQTKLISLYQAQRSYIESLMPLINCDADGTLRARHIIDYWKKPEYIYLGPDENMHNSMIEWISNYSAFFKYKPGSCFISSKPGAGINHKEYGVTSHGVNVCMEECLHYVGIDPKKDTFTIKISGGPDGDVAGNQMLNLYRYYPKTAKLLAITDVSGTIFDPEGLDLKMIAQFVKEGKQIRFYPPEKLHDGGYLLDLMTKKERKPYASMTLFSKKVGNKVVEEWLAGSEMNHLYRSNIFKVQTDVFIPAGGRPRTLNELNWKEFLNEVGAPTSRIIVEGANLYLTLGARKFLEKAGVIIIKDASANKGGVICSSFEVLCNLVMSDEEFMERKAKLVEEILAIIATKARLESSLMLKTYKEKGTSLIDLSDIISDRINTYTYQILEYLQKIHLPNEVHDPLIQCLIHYTPMEVQRSFVQELLIEVPDIHKKAIISCAIASKLVYERGIEWAPTVVDILPLLAEQMAE